MFVLGDETKNELLGICLSGGDFNVCAPIFVFVLSTLHPIE